MYPTNYPSFTQFKLIQSKLKPFNYYQFHKKIRFLKFSTRQ